ncbi:MAG: DUF4332 domain-containing protein [Anaerolineales bacterium]|nr:DUF4332 domain-containing protein [Anaerolineales bacterium]
MDEEFRRFLRSGGRSEKAARRIMAYVAEYENFLREQRSVALCEAGGEDLEAFVAWVEQRPKASAKGYLWGIVYYYQYSSNEEMGRLAGILREQRIERKPFPLKEFRGVNPEHVEKLAAVGIRDVTQMLAAGRTQSERAALSEQSGVAGDAILTLVKLSDLARIPGVKGIRARLYLDAGVDTLEKLATWEPEALREMLAGFVERTGFEGIVPLPAEMRYAVAQARKLPKIVAY